MESQQPKTYHVFKFNGSYYLFDVYKLIYLKISSELYSYISDDFCGKISNEDIFLLQQLMSNNIFFHKDSNFNDESKSINDVISFSIPTEHNCNFACRYCFANAGNNYSSSLQLNEKFIKSVCEYLFQRYPYVDNFRFEQVSGGEPFINKKTLYLLLYKLKEIFEQNNKNLNLWICTNGSLLTIDDIIKLEQNNVGFGISLDGDKYGNINRKYSDGSNTYDDVIKNIKIIQKNELIAPKSKQLWGLVVISPQNYKLIDILKHHKALGFTNIQMKLVRTDKTSPLNFKKETIEKLFKEISKFFSYLYTSLVEGDLSNIMLIMNDNDYIGKILIRLLLKHRALFRCDAGIRKLSFTLDGYVYPCDSFVGNKNFCLDNIFYPNNHPKQFSRPTIFERTMCQSCWIRFICGGDCYYNSLINTNDISVPDEFFCEVNKFIAKNSIEFLSKLKTTRKDIYQKLLKLVETRNKMIRM